MMSYADIGGLSW